MIETSDRQVPEISILVVAYNSAELISNCLESIPAACTSFRYEVLLIDNGDGSTQSLVSKRYPQVRIVPSRGNVGFAAGNNLLASFAQSQRLLLLNPDVELLPAAIDSLLEASRAYPQASAWGGLTLHRNGLPDVGNTVHLPSLSEMASRTMGRSSASLPANKSFEEDERVDVLSGGFVMIARSAWDEAGGLDERYFLYCEEVDLFYRLGKTGHTFWRIADARAYHDIGHGAAISPKRMLYRSAGLMQFARLHWTLPRELAAFLLIWLGAVQRYLIGSAFARLGERYRSLRDGYRAVATKPGHWRRGYDPQSGLLKKMAKEQQG